jgi:PAS domain S-box-containing protein
MRTPPSDHAAQPLASVLVVDDQSESRRRMAKLLASSGYRSLMAASGETALKLARAERPSLIVTDILVSGMNAFELARRLRDDRELADVRILLWTDHAEEREVGELAAALHVDGVIDKASAPETLLAAVRDLLAPVPSTNLLPKSAAEFDREQVRALSVKLIEKAAELERTRGALRESEEGFRLLVGNIPGAVYRRRLDADMTIEFVSDTIEEITGFSAAGLAHSEQRTYASVVHPDDRERVAEEIRTAVAGDQHYGLAYRIVRSDRQEAWVGDRGRAVDGGGGVVWLYGTVSDINERKRMEADHSRMELELRMAQKLEAVGQLAAGIAHEINTPIQFVGDSLHFLRESFEDLERLLGVYREVVAEAPVTRALLERIADAEEEADIAYLHDRVPAAYARTLEGVERVASIVGAMKAFAHPQTEQAPSDLNQALKTTLTVARNEYRYVADVDTDFGDLPLVVCNLSDVNQVFLNLIVNAAHAIEDSPRPAGELGRIAITTERDGDAALVRIGDSGVGIPDEITTRIFDPFFTTKTVGRGSGQGLAISRAVVEKHGGTLDFETVLGTGTTFTIRLPIAGMRVAA